MALARCRVGWREFPVGEDRLHDFKAVRDPVDAIQHRRIVHAGIRRAGEAEDDLRLDARLDEVAQRPATRCRAEVGHGAVGHIAPVRRVDAVFRPDGAIGEADLAADDCLAARGKFFPQQRRDLVGLLERQPVRPRGKRRHLPPAAERGEDLGDDGLDMAWPRWCFGVHFRCTLKRRERLGNGCGKAWMPGARSAHTVQRSCMIPAMARKPQPLKSIRSLVLLGAGKMGSAMLEGWLARGLNPKKHHSARAAAKQSGEGADAARAQAQSQRESRTRLRHRRRGEAADRAEAVPLLAAYVGKGTLVVSIMAGRTIGFLQQNLPANTAIVRAIPNTPAAIGRGISGAVANARSSPRQRKQATDLLAAIGAVEWVSNEALMDAVTAVSGSGPAYVFLLAEAMTQAGIAAGLPAELAARLARETVAGAGELLRRSELDAATLRQNVTSPGGTTAAALGVLMGPGGFDTLLTQAIAAATRRRRNWRVKRAHPDPPRGEGVRPSRAERRPRTGAFAGLH